MKPARSIRRFYHAAALLMLPGCVGGPTRPAESLALDIRTTGGSTEGPLHLSVGVSIALEAVLLHDGVPVSTSPDITYRSRAEAIASVTADGEVRALGTGTTWVVAEAALFSRLVQDSIVVVVGTAALAATAPPA